MARASAMPACAQVAASVASPMTIGAPAAAADRAANAVGCEQIVTAGTPIAASSSRTRTDSPSSPARRTGRVTSRPGASAIAAAVCRMRRSRTFPEPPSDHQHDRRPMVRLPLGSYRSVGGPVTRALASRAPEGTSADPGRGPTPGQRGGGTLDGDGDCERDGADLVHRPVRPGSTGTPWPGGSADAHARPALRRLGRPHRGPGGRPWAAAPAHAAPERRPALARQAPEAVRLRTPSIESR